MEDHHASYMGFSVEKAIAEIVSRCHFFLTISCVKLSNEVKSQ